MSGQFDDVITRTGLSPGLAAINGFIAQNQSWQRRTDGFGSLAFGRTYEFSDPNQLPQFTAELLFRKHRAQVPGNLAVNGKSLDITIRALEPDESGGEQIALAQSLDMLFAETAQPKES